MKILMCPGQGSQTEGFLTAWFESVPGFERKIAELSEAAGKDLVRLGTTATESEIKATENAQPLIVAASIAAHRTVMSSLAVSGAVGHSVGEFAAAAISSVITDDEAMRLVAIRANAMAEAATKHPTSMAAVLGGDIEVVEATISNLGLTIANYNGAGQLVAAGDKDAISSLVATPPEKSRVIELKVAGAFHTHYMASAVEALAAARADIKANDPKIRLWSNVAGQEVHSGADFLDSLVTQVSNPVRWDMCMNTLDGLMPLMIELPPAGALAGLVKRGMPNSQAIALKSIADLEKIGD